MVILPNNVITPSTIKLRNNVLKGLTIAITFSSLVVSIINFVHGNIFICLLDFLLFLFCVYTLLEHKKGNVKNWQKITITSLYIFAISVVSVAGGLLSGIPFWLLTFPVLLYLLFGRKHGAIGSGLLLLIETVILYINTSVSEQYSVFSIIVNLVLAYIVIWTVSHVYEVNREKSEQALIKLAMRDPLTKTYNRLALTDYFASLYTKQPLTLALLDVDNFKKINDLFGHDTGDIVLIQIAKALKRVTGENNIFRIGGEEFVVLFVGEQQHNACTVIELLRDAVETESFSGLQKNIRVTISIGVAESNTIPNLTKLLKEADRRLYQAKSAGKNCIMTNDN
jgi:diguanylate cyclase (GGDEF)-like protein